jgi:hypothetical protein
VKVADGRGGSAEQSFVITVTEPVAPAVKPKCTITFPLNGTGASKKLAVKGTAIKGTAMITRVEVRVDEGPWQTASGTDNWTLEIDLAGLANGRHTVEAKAFDGTLWSDSVKVDVLFNNPGGHIESGGTLFLPIILVAVIAAGICAGLFLWKKKGGGRRAFPAPPPPVAEAIPLQPPMPGPYQYPQPQPYQQPWPGGQYPPRPPV